MAPRRQRGRARCATPVGILTFMLMTTIAHPPETLEGWYLLHQVYALDRALTADASHGIVDRALEADALLAGLAPPGDADGWSIAVALVGSTAELMIIHARPTLDALGDAQRRLAAAPLFAHLRAEYSFLSVTEAGLYHLTAELAAEAAGRGGRVGDEEYRARMAARAESERGSAHVRRRLYPPVPADLPYVCFYPMSKRRDPGANWYQLTLDERSALMHAHGTTGRRYAGRIQQVISGAIGLDAWEWGVTLFGRDPLDFKRLVTDMRFDEVSAQYATFGRFFVGRRGTFAGALGA